MTIDPGHGDTVILSGAGVLVDTERLIPQGAVAVRDGIIRACGSRAGILRQFPSVREIHHSGAVLMPGLINIHTHLELTFLANMVPPPAYFPEWVLQLMAGYPAAPDAPRVFAASALSGADESLRFGVTTVGDITRQHAIVRPALQGQTPLRVVSFGEITSLGRSRGLLESRLAAAMNQECSDDRIKIGLSPHAPYSVEGPSLQKIVAAARQHQLPLCMHLAELREEREFLSDFSGPLGKHWTLMKHLDLLDEFVPRYANGPIRWAEHYGLFDAGGPVILAHVNYADDTELDILARAGAAVAYCPRTRHYFGHDDMTPHPWQAMQARGIRVCLATDSKASNPDLSVLREAQFIQQREPAVNCQSLLAMMTTQPAAALGMDDHLGRLAPGYAADILAMPIPLEHCNTAGEVARDLIQRAALPQRVYIGGEIVISSGEPVAQGGA
jgi:cytosine/adenosine deaminase-related metal-dependent hydrolase